MFERDAGPCDEAGACFVARGSGYALSVAHNGVAIMGPDGTRSFSFAGGAAPTSVRAEASTARANYLIGNDRSKWRTNVPLYESVRYRDIYPGIDVLFYGRQGLLEYDFLLEPHANPDVISLRFETGAHISIDDAGDLTFENGDRPLRLRRPHVYQDAGGHRVEIEGQYALVGPAAVAFRLGPYDRDRELTIDPVIVFSTEFGGSGRDSSYQIAVDAAGQTYVTGTTWSADFPDGDGRTSRSSVPDAFVMKIASNGHDLVYATYLGGNDLGSRGSDSGAFETGYDIAVGSDSTVFLTGTTSSTDFPIVNAYQPRPSFLRGFDWFLSRLSADGASLIYSTYFSGTNLAVDVLGNAYVGGIVWRADFPSATRIGPAGKIGDFSIAKFSPQGSLLWATRIGASGFPADETNSLRGIDVDGSGQVHIVGSTRGSDFPIVNGWISSCPTYRAECGAGFLAKLNASGTQLLYSTYLGSSTGELAGELDGSTPGTVAYDVAVDGQGNAYVAGTTSMKGLPTVNAAQREYGGGALDNFVASFDPSGRIRYSTYLGGPGAEAYGVSVAVDPAGYANVTGITQSTDFPLSRALLTSHPGGPVFLSFNRGQHWASVSKGLNRSARALATDPRTTGTLYAATDAGLYRSIDYGATWIASDAGLPRVDAASRSVSVTSIAIDPADSRIVYAAMSVGLFKSVDGGLHWSGIDPGGGQIAITPTAPSALFRGGTTLRRSTDGGATWTPSGAGLPALRNVYGITLSTDARTMYLVGDVQLATFSFRPTVFKSSDSGSSWASTSTSLNTGASPELAIDPHDSNIVYARSSLGVFKTSDGGNNWVRLLANSTGSIAVAPDGVVYVALTNSGVNGDAQDCVLRSTDAGQSWTAAWGGVAPTVPCEIGRIAFDAGTPGTLFAASTLSRAAYLTRFSPNGSFDYSTFLPQIGYLSIGVDPLGRAYLAGVSDKAANSQIGVMKVDPASSARPPIDRRPRIREPR